MGDAEDTAFSSGTGDTAAVGSVPGVGDAEAPGSGVALVSEAGLFFIQAASASASRIIRSSAIKRFFMVQSSALHCDALVLYLRKQQITLRYKPKALFLCEALRLTVGFTDYLEHLAAAIESAVLGIGPSTAASACIMSGLFLALYLVPVNGIQELGILGAIGSLLNWGLSILLTAALLQLFQRKKPFTVNAFRFQREYKFKLLSYRANKIFIAIVSVASLIACFYGSNDMKFFYDFKQTEITHQKSEADSLLAQTGFPQYDPIIVMLPNQAAGDDLLRNFQELKKKNRIPDIDRMYTLAQFSPKRQVETMRKLKSIKKSLNNRFLQELDSADLHDVTRLLESLYRIDFDENEVPEDLRHKFSDNGGNQGVFAYIFSSIDPNNGLECRHLHNDLKKFDGIENGTYKIAGTPVIRATFLDLVLKNINKTLVAGSLIILFILLLYYNRFSRAIFTLLPSVFAMGWLVFMLRFLGMGISAYSSIAFAILFALSVDGSLQLWTAYYEKQGGTALNVLQRKFFTVGISQLAALIGTYGLFISSHPGLRSIGQMCLIGLICISVSQFTIFPLIAGSLDSYRLHRQKKQS